MATQSTRRVVFLDRDGTINIDHGYVHRIDQWDFLPGAVEALALLRSSGFRLAVVTNQAGVGRGYYSADDVERLHQFVQAELKEHGTTIDAFAFCTHHPDDGCRCRKPQTDMAGQIEQRLGERIDFTSSWTVGDKISDIEFGRAIGTRTALIRSQYWDEGDLNSRPEVVADSLAEAANRLLSWEPLEACQ